MASTECSRLCVKNIPKYMTEERLKAHFEQQGEVTDVKILRTKSGHSRKMAFVGYRSGKTARKAMRYFNKSFVDTSKLTVEIALPVGDKNLKRPWSKHSKVQEVSESADVNSADGSGAAAEKPKPKDKKLDEFLALMQPRWKAQFWSNDNPEAVGPREDAVSQGGPASASENVGNGGAVDSEESEGEDESEEEEDDESDGESDDDDDESSDEGEENDKADGAAGNTNMSDLDYLRSKMTEDFSSDEEEDDKEDSSDSEEEEEDDDDEEDSGDNVDKEDSNDGNDATSKKDTSENGPDAAETGRLFVRNLAFATSEEELRAAFSRFGTVAETHLPLDGAHRPRGYGYVSYLIPEDAVRALSEMDGAIFQGRLLHVLPAAPRPGAAESGSGGGGGGSSYKAQQDAERRAKAADETAWNALFIRSDAAVSVVSKQLGLSKGEVLDATEAGGESLAVRVAMAETQVVADAKAFLAAEGVSLEALEAALHKGPAEVKRSDCVLLVKNLPHDTEEAELQQMFARHGELEKPALSRVRERSQRPRCS